MTLEKRFKKDFKDGMEMWTSEDGMSIAVLCTPDGVKILRQRVLAVNPRKRFKEFRIKMRYASREWLDSDYFYHRGERGKGWRIVDQETPFQVWEYELETPV